MVNSTDNTLDLSKKEKEEFKKTKGPLARNYSWRAQALLGLSWGCSIHTLPHWLEYFWYFTGCIVIWFWIQFRNVKCYELNLWKPHGKRTLVFEAILNKWISENTILHNTKNIETQNMATFLLFGKAFIKTLCLRRNRSCNQNTLTFSIWHQQ